MHVAALRALRWIVERERQPAFVAARTKRRPIRLLNEIYYRRQFEPSGLDGAVWITGTGAATQRAISHLNVTPTVVSKRTLRWCISMRLLRCCWRLRRSYDGNIATRFLRFMLEYQNARRLLDAARPSALVVNNDYSETALAFALACEHAKARVILFQASEMNRTPALHKADVAYAYDPTIFAEKAGQVVRLELPYVPLRPIPDKPVIGVALNNFTDRSRVLAAVEVLRTISAAVLVRRHPNSTEPLDMTETDPAEPLSDFLARCDVLVCGNTSAQADAIRHGVPVIHCGDLDDLPFDSIGLVANGTVYGVRTVAEISINDAARFYEARQASGVGQTGSVNVPVSAS